MLTPIGVGCVENGFSRDHRTGTFAVMGAMLKSPMAENCTIPLEDVGSAAMGLTVMLCIWRVELIIMELPPQEAINRKAIATAGTRRAVEYLRKNAVRAYRLRIDTSKDAEGQEIALQIMLRPSREERYKMAFGLAMPSRIWNKTSQRFRLTVIKKFSLACALPFLPSCVANSGCVSR